MECDSPFANDKSAPVSEESDELDSSELSSSSISALELLPDSLDAASGFDRNK